MTEGTHFGGSGGGGGGGGDRNTGQKPSITITWVNVPQVGGGSGRVEPRTCGHQPVELVENAVRVPLGTEEIFMIHAPGMTGVKAETDGRRLFIIAGSEAKPIIPLPLIAGGGGGSLPKSGEGGSV